MMVSTVVRATTALVAAAGLANAALPPLTHKGQFLFDSATGQRFNIKGVAYATTYGETQANKPTDDLMQRDALANVEGCRRDVPFLQQLGVNVIRVYQIKADADHSACMQLLDEAGIYVFADLATHIDAISGDAPRWNIDLMQHYLETVVELGQYSNTIGFLVGNEVLNGPADTKAAPYLKAAIRDVKAWMTAHGYNQIVGYAATDKPESRATLPYYFACEDPDKGVTSSTVADFWGINLYEWCGTTTYESSGYRERTQELVGTGLVSLMTENGCGVSGTRAFDDTPVIFSPAMDYVWSGSIAFEFFNQGNTFGIVQLSPDGATVTPTADFGRYQAQLAAVQPSTMTLNAYSPNVTLPLPPSQCPTPDAAGFPVANKLPPTPNNALCECAVAASSCSVSASITPADLATAFETVCGLDSEACESISGDGTMTSGGVYGAYSMCAPQQQLAIVMGAYQTRHTGATCEFGGLGAAKTPSGTEASCAATAFPNGVGAPTPSAPIEGAPAPTNGNNPGNTPGGGTTPGGNQPGDAAFGVTVPAMLVACGALVVSLLFA